MASSYQMNEAHKKKLKENHILLLKNLIMDESFLHYMSTDNIATDSMLQTIRSIPETLTDKRNAEFLLTLPRRGPKAFGVFLEALMRTDQEFLVQALDPEFVVNWQARAAAAAAHNSTPISIVAQPSVHPVQPVDRVQVIGPPSSEENYRDAIMTVDVKLMSKDDITRHLNDTEGVYPMRRKPRGRALIINVITFEGVHMQPREGATYDSMNMSSLLRELKFEVVEHTNLTSHRIIEVIKEESVRPEHKDADALIVCVMSHGAAGLVYGSDNGKVNIEKDIVMPFNGYNCPDLIDKPKIFIIQACQGEGATVGVPVTRHDAVAEGHLPVDELLKEKELATLRMGDRPDTIPILPNIPELADTVLAYATVSGFRAYRNSVLGSWFIRALVRNVCEYSHTEDFLTLMTKVINDVSKLRTDDGKLMYGIDHFKQLPEVRTRLRRKIYFFTGHVEC